MVVMGGAIYGIVDGVPIRARTAVVAMQRKAVATDIIRIRRGLGGFVGRLSLPTPKWDFGVGFRWRSTLSLSLSLSCASVVCELISAFLTFLFSKNYATIYYYLL
jgi:hypothetical protein